MCRVQGEGNEVIGSLHSPIEKKPVWEVWETFHSQDATPCQKHVLLSQNCFGYSGSSVVPYKFKSICSSFLKKCHWHFDRITLTLQVALESMAILTLLILPIHEHDRSFLCLDCFQFLSSLSYSFLRTGLYLLRWIYSQVFYSF